MMSTCVLQQLFVSKWRRVGPSRSWNVSCYVLACGSQYRGDNINPPLRKFWPDFLSGVLLFPNCFRRFAAGFCCFQKFPPPAAGIYCCPKIRMFVENFHCFFLEKAQNFPAASRQDLVIQKFPAASRRGFCISRFLRKVDSGDLQWGVKVISPVCTHKFSASNSICKILKTQQRKNM